jgi:electron transfer flavoprotein alpha subunit
MKALIIAEHDNTQLKSVNEHTLTAATQLNAEIDMIIIGFNCDNVAMQAQGFSSLRTIWVANAAEYEHQLPENGAALIADIVSDHAYDYVIMGATTFGKNILPRVSGLLDTAMISDVIKIISPDTFIRPIYAGNALATVQTKEPIKMLTVRATSFPAASNKQTSKAPIKQINKIIPNHLSQFINQELTVHLRPELTSARIIVSGGRGLKSAENFKILEKIADRLGAAVGATRAAVDAGFVPNDYQIGQTGKIVAPDLYIAMGISGAIQHLAGMKDSKIIVAINSDPDAPIFQIADYGLVADLFVAANELIDELNNKDT